MKKPLSFLSFYLKLKLRMKLTILILCLCVMQVSASIPTKAQNFSLQVQNQTLKEVLKTIESKTSYRFFYNDFVIDLNKVVTLNLSDKDIQEVMNELLDNSDVSYKILNNNLIVIAPAIELQQQTVKGTVADASSGEPLIGVSVRVDGTTTGAITDANGKFSIETTANAVLVFSFLGYNSEKITVVAGQTTLDVKLVADIQKLEEVVVVGYGTQKRTTITGSVSAVKGDVVAKIPVANISNALSGQMTGVQTRQNGGKPGSDNSDIHIRGIGTTGNSNPLVVVNGVVRNDINQVDPSTIESVSILKDAAAVAPYGIGGANGVILITTKSGAAGASSITYNTYYGWQSPTYYPNLLNAVDYMTLMNEATLNNNANAVLPYDASVISNYASLHASDPDKYADSRTKDLVHLTVPMVKHDLQISGGNEKTKYYSSINYYKQDGVFDKVNYRRYSYNLNFDSKITKTTKFNGTIIGTYELTNDLDDASSANQIFRGSYKYIPTMPLVYSNGLPGLYAGNAPISVLNSNGYHRDKVYNAMSSASIEQEIPFIKGLSIKGVFSYDARFQYTKGYHEPFKYWNIDLNANPRTFTPAFSGQEVGAPTYIYLTQNDQRWDTYTYQAYLNYNNTFGKHNVTGLLVAEKRNGEYNQLTARRNNFGLNIDEMSMGSSNKTDFDNGGKSDVNAQVGYVYRFGWTYNNKYMLEAAGRYDGSYYFDRGSRWAFFPSFSAGWRISEEQFMKPLEWISNLKLRGSWGKSGMLAGSAYQYLFGYTLMGNSYAFGTGNMVQGAYVDYENNPTITWEKSTKLNFALEASLWKDLLTIEMEAFYERRGNMLLNPIITLPVEYGLKMSQTNEGVMTNQGFELTLGSRKQFQNGLMISFNGNMSIATNKLVKTFETPATYNNKNRRRTNRPFNTMFGYQAAGLFSTADDKNGDGVINAADGYNVTQFGILHPGQIKYVDQNGDGKIDSNDETVIGKPNNYPLMAFGGTFQVSWKGFDFSAFFQGAAMTSYNTYNFQTMPFLNNNSNADYEYFNNRWTPNNQDAKYPRAYPAPTNNENQTSSFWVKNASYVRLKNVQLGYSLPKSVIQKIKFKNVRVYIAGQNLLTISGLKFIDPETSYTTTDGTAYPSMKSVSIGANVTF